MLGMINKQCHFALYTRNEINMLTTPKSLEEEHEEIMQSLRQSANLPDGTGKAVKDLLKTLEPHFEKEEKVAMPVLGALTELVSGDKIANLREIAESQGALLQEYENMFQEHAALKKFIERAEAEARKEKHEEVAELLGALAHHARVEEEVLYPAALLAGTVAKCLIPNETPSAVA